MNFIHRIVEYLFMTKTDSYGGHYHTVEDDKILTSPPISKNGLLKNHRHYIEKDGKLRYSSGHTHKIK